MDNLEALEKNEFDAIIRAVRKSYTEPKMITNVWDDISRGGDGNVGDGFATFLVKELMETFDTNADLETQLVDACTTINRAMDDLKKIHLSLCGSICCGCISENEQQSPAP